MNIKQLIDSLPANDKITEVMLKTKRDMIGSARPGHCTFCKVRCNSEVSCRNKGNKVLFIGLKADNYLTYELLIKAVNTFAKKDYESFSYCSLVKNVEATKDEIYACAYNTIVSDIYSTNPLVIVGLGAKVSETLGKQFKLTLNNKIGDLDVVGNKFNYYETISVKDLANDFNTHKKKFIKDIKHLFSIN